VGDDDVELAVVVELDGDDCGRVEARRVGEGRRRTERAVAVAREQRKANLRVVDGDDEVESSVAVEVAGREVLTRTSDRIVDPRAERPGAVVQTDRGGRSPCPSQVKTSVAVEVSDDVVVSEDGVVRSGEGWRRRRSA
jgi:sRNA-binding protein